MQKIYNVFVSKPCTLKIQTSKYITKKPHQSILQKKPHKKHEFVNISNGYQIILRHVLSLTLSLTLTS